MINFLTWETDENYVRIKEIYMCRNQKAKPLKELNLTNRFLFDAVMEDPQTQQDALSIIFGQEIPLLDKNESEKEFRVSPLIRSIRMDVFSMDRERVIYNTEMQGTYRDDLAKRSRYYQSLLDSSLLEPGVISYNLLNQTYIIMFMPFDLFGYGRYVYTFRAVCQEEPECLLGDGATRIFLNTRGTNDEEVSPELVEFLHYLENTTDKEAAQSDSERIKRIHNRVCKVKANEEIGVKYMQAWEERIYDRQEAREEGLAEGQTVGEERARMILKLYMQGCNAEEIAAQLELTVEKVKSILE